MSLNKKSRGATGVFGKKKQNSNVPSHFNEKSPARQAVFNFCCNDCAKRAKTLLRKYKIRMKIRGCDALCKFPHVGHINATAAKVEQIFGESNFDGDWQVVA